ncbi:PREDICTED: uncharacterized protein LOC109355298 isoform X2 [Lupinus angustifolius]|uniref:uncharacterized protein LOC109355298 isoform X2 n=1 Tax=Lupinus angustifolius TaxID=3871 RepID=UPI00092F039C|nr:PREDICTED: uncharacterized protein LOC109355298 isoform X2 [Lupinus angustifolius]
MKSELGFRISQLENQRQVFAPLPASRSFCFLLELQEFSNSFGPLLKGKFCICFVDIYMARSRNVIVAAGLIAFASAGLAFPFYMASSRKPVIDPTKPLSPQATFRGPYINTGSRDIGPDHRTYEKK